MSEIRHTSRAPTTAERRAGGEVIDRHRHNDHQLVYVSTGVLALQTEVGAWVASSDRAIWIPAGTWHQHRFYGASSLHTVGFPVASAPLRESAPVVVAVSALLRELLIACTDPALPAEETRRVRAVVRDQLRRARVQPVTLPAARDDRLASACDLVLAGLDQPRTLAFLARSVGTSERTLARLFRAEFGMTYPQWRTNVRVFQAMIELAGGSSVTEAGHRCGWATTSAFIDTFRQAMGQTPGAYRATCPRTPRSP
jgi:AraC-like DNA-binding protein